MVTNYCGSIDKGIAFVCGLAVSAVCECAVTGVLLPWNAVLALVFVAQGGRPRSCARVCVGVGACLCVCVCVCVCKAWF